jgi:hypothetical protein
VYLFSLKFVSGPQKESLEICSSSSSQQNGAAAAAAVQYSLHYCGQACKIKLGRVDIHFTRLFLPSSAMNRQNV